jgi:GNAT superfamily N-acetyltransferase
MAAPETTIPALAIIEYSDDLAGDFSAINRAWIETMFVLEPHDEDVLNNPRKWIIDKGGVVLFVEAQGRGIVGAGALMPDGTGGLELTKMGVREDARGLHAGSFLLAALIARARQMKPTALYLLTSHKCAAAIHLYEKAGFAHSPDTMRRFGQTYARCDVAMRYDDA